MHGRFNNNFGVRLKNHEECNNDLCYCESLMTCQSIDINTIKLIPTNNQKTGVNESFLMSSRIAIKTKELIPINIQKTVINVISF